MKRIVCFFLLGIGSLTAISQSQRLFEKFTFDSSYKIVGICSQLDEKQEYHKWTFIISDFEKLKQAQSVVTCGEKIQRPVFDDFDMEIQVLRDKEVIESYDVSPVSQYVNWYPTDSTPGVFHFDISQILQLADVKPVNHRYKNVSFKTEEDFKHYLTANKNKKNFLSYEDISEEQSGRFSITIPKTNSIQKFRDGWTLIENELNRVTPNKKDYLMSFNLTGSTDSTFFYQVNTSKTLYKKFNLKGYKKSNWTANLIEFSTIWLK